MLVPVVGALIVGLIARFGSERIRGHGIPEAIEAILDVDLTTGSQHTTRLTVGSQVPCTFDIAGFGVGSSHIDDVVSVYSSVFLSPTDRSRQIVLDAMRRNDFAGRLALVDGVAVAMGYGAATKVGHWWYDGIAEALGSDHPALQSAWNLMELAVLPSFRRRGIATALVDNLLAAQPCPRALLSVIVHNAPARTFYENRGWRYLHPDLTFTATPNRRYAIMGRELR